MNTMPIAELIEKVAEICKKNRVEHLSLFGSFATGTATDRSDIDFVVYGCKDILQLETDLMEIDTLHNTFCKSLKNLEKSKYANPK